MNQVSKQKVDFAEENEPEQDKITNATMSNFSAQFETF